MRPFFAGNVKMAFASPLAVILAPTRELCVQIDEQVYSLTAGTQLTSFAIYGGNNYVEQTEQIAV